MTPPLLSTQPSNRSTATSHLSFLLSIQAIVFALQSSFVRSLPDVLSLSFDSHYNAPPPILAMSRHRRQATSDPLAVPTGIAGISPGAVTVGTAAATNSGFVFDSTATGAPSPGTAPAFAPGTSVVVTTTPLLPTPSSAATDPSNLSSATGKSPIPLSTVIAACVAALVGAAAVIFTGWWLYKRSYRNSKNRPRRKSRAPLTDNRNNRGEFDRSKSRHETWAKLEDGDTKWEEQYQTKEVDSLAPMEKLTMFSKATSIRSTIKGSPVQPNFDHHPFAQYHSNIAEELSGAPQRQFLGRVDTGPPLSWDDEGSAASNDAFLTVPHLATGAMTPTRSVAIPTPQAIPIEPHRWESAEVMDFDEELASYEGDHKMSFASRRLESRGDPNGKGKQRAQDPFADEFVARPRLPGMHVTTPSSSSSHSNNERAIQSLIAVLDVTPEEVQERLRVASMQPSTISSSSYIYEDDMTAEFPLPPS